MKESTGLNVAGEAFAGKSKEALNKLQSLREDFSRRENRIRADLEEAGSIWKKVSKKFKWWQSLP